MPTLENVVARLANRDAPRTEATVQADVRQLLLTGSFDLTADVLLEAPVGDLRRIDIEVGATVIEVKKDLRAGKVREEAAKQLAGYVESRAATYKVRYVGVLTDGAEWVCYHLSGGKLLEVTRHEVSARKPDVDGLVIWLEGVLATARNLPPSPEEIRRRLGAASSAHLLDRASLAALFAANKGTPAVRTRRNLWARLLETALGTQFEDRDDLFIEHTLLVNIGDIIAHAVLGLAPETLAPSSILSGERFQEAGIFGVVEADFFDWATEVPGGEDFIRTLARRIARFDWSLVQHDVLKVLYESIVTAEVRKKLGEYYTPDWLAEKVVEATIPEPLSSRALDPACGSGTFLFHAVRRYLAAARTAKAGVREQLDGVTRHVVGMDLHPVAVSLARVTYLLAIGPELLRHKARREIRVSVFLGDSVQWRQKNHDLFSETELSVPINDTGELFVEAKSEFRFPNVLLKDAQKFDALISELADVASARKPGSVAGILQRHSVPSEVRPAVEATFRMLHDLHERGRDHVWGYFIRNLARPTWLMRPENKVDVLIGNPPWLAYRFMLGPMQADFKLMSERRGLWHGAKVATHQDLSVLFVVRAAELYLKEGGRFGFVLPSAVLDRKQYAGFRKGVAGDFPLAIRLSFDAPWDLRRLRPHFFPISASVAFGRRTPKARAMPPAREVWSGRLPGRNASWSEVAGGVVRTAVAVEPPRSVQELSPYHERFRQGATVVPRMLFLVEKRDPGPLGHPAHTTKVISARSASEKRPWKDLQALEGAVEKEFIFRLHLGETVLPYRTLTPKAVVLPITSKGRLYAGDPKIHSYEGLTDWWMKAERCWNEHRSSEQLSLAQRLDFHRELTHQFPLLPLRIVYAKSGMHLAAAKVEDHRAVIDHKLYWASAASEEEANYLSAVLNSAVVTARVRPLMSYGKDERDIDKYAWRLPIPMFDPDNKSHARLAQLGQRAEAAVAELQIDGEKHFSAARRTIREWLEASEIGRQIESAVTALLG